MNFSKMADTVKRSETISHIGKIKNVLGMTVECTGSKASIGDINIISVESSNQNVMAEVVGFKDENIVLMPYENISGLSVGDFVRNTKQQLRIPVGDFLQGRIINSLANPIDNLGPFPADTGKYNVGSTVINPLERPLITQRIDLGVKAIDGMLTLGKGQRIGIFAGSGVGKSTLMGMIAKNVSADINVIALVGERGREVREFIDNDLGEEGLKRSVLVVATSDQPAMLRMKCPLVATAIAEYFKDQGKDVFLMMDSLTRFAMAQREIGLAVGEPPVARGYTPSIYAEMPKLLERSGNFESGSITGLYTVLVEGDDTNEPISDTVRGILDGHIILSRKMAAKNHFPAIEIGPSVSRLMTMIVSQKHRDLAAKIREILSTYAENADLIAIGAYKSGINPKLDYAVKKSDQVNEFLKQGINESFSYEETLKVMESIFKD